MRSGMERRARTRRLYSVVNRCDALLRQSEERIENERIAHGPDARSVKELEKERAELIAEREKLVDRCVKTDDLGLKTSS